ERIHVNLSCYPCKIITKRFDQGSAGLTKDQLVERIHVSLSCYPCKIITKRFDQGS
ncbi:hypothetical protein LOTGIDRAFT_57658, partial [Lottia gigantea]